MNVNPHARTEISICPGCGARIRFQNKVQVGEFVICDECGDELEVVNDSPIKLDWAYEDALDDDSDYDYDEDFNDEEYDDDDDEYDDWDDED